jgi:hypothetical protein
MISALSAFWLVRSTAGESSDTYHALLNDGIDTGGIPLNVLSSQQTGTDISAPSGVEKSAPENSFVNGVCGGTTRAGFTAWRKYGRALDLHIDSSHCASGELKNYIVSVVQGGSGNIFAGNINIYNTNEKDFRVFVYHTTLSGDALLAAAQKNWVVSWILPKNDYTNANAVSSSV